MESETRLQILDMIVSLHTNTFVKVYGLVWFGFFVKWHINLCSLFNAKAILKEEQ